MSARPINEEELRTLIASGKPLLVDYWAPWCGDCRRIAQAYDRIAEDYAGEMEVVKLNVEEAEGIRERDDIRRIPTLRLFGGGEAIGQIVEPPSRADIEAFLAPHFPQRERSGADRRIHDMIVIGGGPGGYTAALYAARAGLDVLVLERLGAGGQMALTHRIDNYPGFPAGIGGPELGLQMQQQAERFGAKTLNALVRRVKLEETPKVIQTSEGSLRARTVVLAMGAVPRPLGLKDEEALRGRGVSYCAACDGMLYKGRSVVVVGGGNSAATDALILSRIASRVTLVHRRDRLQAEQSAQDALAQSPNVEFCLNSEVTALLHGDEVTGVRLRSTVTGEEREIPCDGVFISIGREPATELVKEQLKLENGYIAADETTATSLPGVYAVGDVRTKRLRQVVTAVADGAVAAHMAGDYLLDP